jgi:hypothetical protein
VRLNGIDYARVYRGPHRALIEGGPEAAGDGGQHGGARPWGAASHLMGDLSRSAELAGEAG